jgi:hypothetical protein
MGLQVAGSAVETRNWAEAGSEVLWLVEETSRRLSTAHRVSIDANPLRASQERMGEANGFRRSTPIPHTTPGRNCSASTGTSMKMQPPGWTPAEWTDSSWLGPGYSRPPGGSDEEDNVTLERDFPPTLT